MTTPVDHLAANLEALRRWNPAAADAVAATAVPPEWQPRFGTDGTPTFARSGAIPHTIEWLGFTSMPASSAEPLLSRISPGDGNGLGIDLGSGYEWRALLGRLGPGQMLYVLDDDLVRARLVLTVCDLAEPLASGKLVPVFGPDAAEQLHAFVAAHRGFDPPQIIHPLPTLTGPRRNALFTAAERLVRDVMAVRTAEAEKRFALVPGQTPGRTLAFTLTPAHAFERSTAGIVAALGGVAATVALDDHRTASALARVDALHQHTPALIVSDLFRAQLGGTLPRSLALWTVVPPTAGAGYWLPEHLPRALGALDRIVCHAEAHCDRLVEHGLPAAQVQLVPLGVDPAAVVNDQAQRLQTAVAFFADVPSLDSKSLGLELETHVALWAAAQQLMRAEVATLQVSGLADLFRRAQRRCGVRIDDRELDQAFLRGLRDVMLPAVALLVAAEGLSAAGIPLKLVGHGWDQARLTAAAVRTAWPKRASPRQTLEALTETAALVVHVSASGAVLPAVLHAPLAGVPIVAPRCAADERAGGLATLLSAGAQFARPMPNQFVVTVKGLLQDAARRAKLAEEAREHLLAAHTWAHRASALPSRPE